MTRKQGKIEADIQRVKQYKTENLSKKDAARSRTERSHYQRLVDKNVEMIEKFEQELEEKVAQ